MHNILAYLFLVGSFKYGNVSVGNVSVGPNFESSVEEALCIPNTQDYIEQKGLCMANIYHAPELQNRILSRRNDNKTW